MPTIKLTIPRKVIAEIRQGAKAAFPKEWWALLLGTNAGDHVQVDELYIPDDQDAYTSDYVIYEQTHWFAEAEAQARESELLVVGRIHSHPFTQIEAQGCIWDRSQSEGDIDSQRHIVSGICVVQQLKNKRLRTSIRFWGPTVRITVVIK